MTFTFLLSPKAHNEILEAWEWYEDKQTGLGDQFKQEVAKKLDVITANPLQYASKNSFREAQTDVFPYLIVYQINKQLNLIFVVSIFHTSRHPKRKRR